MRLVMNNSESSEAPSVFEYDDYRRFLSDFFAYKKASQKDYSFAVFASKANLASRSHVKKIIDGDRPLSSENIPKFCAALNLTGDESIFFEALVKFNLCKDTDSKRHYYEQLRASSRKVKCEWVDLSDRHLELFKNWYVIPVLEVFDLELEDYSLGGISKIFGSKISPKEVGHALTVLEDLGFIKRDSNEKSGYAKTTPSVRRYNNDIVETGIIDYHKSVFEYVSKQIEIENRNERYLKTLTVAIARNRLQEFFDRVDEFIGSMNREFSTDQGKKESVVQMSCQIMKLTKK